MSRTISDLQTDVSRKLHGTNINKIEGEFSLYDEAARSCLNDIDFFESQRVAQIANAIYTDVYDYALPTDLKGNKILDIRPQANRDSGDNAKQTYQVEFNRFKRDQEFTIKNNSGVRTLQYRADTNSMTVLHTMDSITDNGTWVVGDDATNLTKDTQNFIANASLNFDVSGATTTASIVNTTLSAINLEALEDKGAKFLFHYMPTVITDATFFWGDDATGNYWSDTVTAPQNGSFQVGWNLMRFDWNGATKTGNPDSSDIAALKYSFTYDGVADTDHRVDSITASLGEIYEIAYYSKYLFQNTSGTYLEEVSAVTDTINLELEGYNCLLYKTLELAAPQIQAEDAGFDLALYERKYIEAKKKYISKYPSERIVPKMKYYRSFKPQSRRVSDRFNNPLHR